MVNITSCFPHQHEMSHSMEMSLCRSQHRQADLSSQELMHSFKASRTRSIHYFMGFSVK